MSTPLPPSQMDVATSWINPFSLIFKSMLIDQNTRNDKQRVDAGSTQLTTSREEEIITDEDPNNSNSTIAKDLAALNKIVSGMTPGESSGDLSTASAKAAQAQSQLQADSADRSNQQSQADGAVQQGSNAMGQDSSDLSQVVQLAATIFAVLSTASGILSSHY